MYLAALGRQPRPEEASQALAFVRHEATVEGRDDDLRAWTDLAHVMFNLKEFIFVQ